MLVLAALGFSGGLPNVVVTNVAQVWVSDLGWEVEHVGLLSLLGLPYALKFLWAPAVDRLRLPLVGALGQRRSWIVSAQVCVALGVMALALLGPGAQGSSHAAAFMAVLCVVVACSATQDIVSDAFRMESLAPRQYGMGGGVFVSGYRVAFVVVGALPLVLAERIGWQPAMLLVGGAAVLCGVATLLAREPADRPVPAPGLRAAVVEPAAELVRRWGWRVAVLAVFVLVFRLPDQVGNAQTAPLLTKGLGYSPADLGWVRQAMGFGLTIVGALVGGVAVARLGLMWSLFLFGLLQAASNAGFMVLAHLYGATVEHAGAGGLGLTPLVVVISIESFCGGLVSAGFVGFLMSVCSRRNVAMQYAMLSALMALSGAVAGGLSGWFARELDFAWFFGATVALGLPGVLLIAAVRPPADREPAPIIEA